MSYLLWPTEKFAVVCSNRSTIYRYYYIDDTLFLVWFFFFFSVLYFVNIRVSLKYIFGTFQPENVLWSRQLWRHRKTLETRCNKTCSIMLFRVETLRYNNERVLASWLLVNGLLLFAARMVICRNDENCFEIYNRKCIFQNKWIDKNLNWIHALIVLSTTETSVYKHFTHVFTKTCKPGWRP